MSLYYPISRLFVSEDKTVSVACGCVSVFETGSGTPLQTIQDASGPIRSAAVDSGFRWAATAGDDKQLRLWNLADGSLVNQRELPKKPTTIMFTGDASRILVADKFGDVFSYAFDFVPVEKKQKDALSSHENPSGGELILGHASPLNAFLLTADEKYIVTADRDEHVRVSWFPKGYIIERYCLGHLKFVSAVHIPRTEPSRLITGGGDPVLKIWDWLEGKVVAEIGIWEAVEPFIAVQAVGRRNWEEDDGEKPEAKRRQENETPEKVLAVKRIETVEVGGVLWILFSAIGATALFAVPFGGGSVVHLNFGRPVLDFALAAKGIMVSLDGQWTPRKIDVAVPLGLERQTAVVRLVDGQLVESTEYAALVAGLANGPTGTQDELRKLDLYGDLAGLPKWTPPETEEDEGVSRRELSRNKKRDLVQQMSKRRGSDAEGQPAVKKSKSTGS